MTAGGLGVVVAVGLAVALDRTVREPPSALHPVALFGRAVEPLGDRRHRHPALAGAVVACGSAVGAAALVYAALWLTTAFPWPITAALAGVVLWTTSSLWLLLASAREVLEATEADLGGAREALPALAGRDAADLSPELLRSAAVESLAENLSDGLVAPLLAFAVLSVVSLPAAAAAAAFVRAVDTLDSMFGYPGAFGRASARLDDLVMFVPARLTAVLLGVAGGDPDAPLRSRRYADATPSPNAGRPMGALAAALDVRLEKPEVYVLNGIADYPTVADGGRALRATRRAGLSAYGIVALFGVVRWL